MRPSAFTMPADDAESGFTLLEVVIAMAVFTAFAAISLGVFINTTDVAGDNIRRTAATNLLNTQLQTARGLSAQAIPDGRTVTIRAVGGTSYTITQTANYMGSGASASICSGTGSALAYKLVTVRVTWENMGSVKPIRGDTLRAVGIGDDGLDATRGTVALSVVGSTGQPTADVEVTLNPGNIKRITGDDGCAVFTDLAPGGYSATANTVGYVGKLNTQAANSAPLSSVAGGINRGSLLYDTERKINVVFDGPVGAQVPSNLQLRAGNSYVPETQLPLCVSGSTSACISAVPGTTSDLFPESYQFRAGTCTETNPSQVSADIRPASTNGSTVTVPMGAVTVKVVLNAAPTVGVSGRNVIFTHVPTAGCPLGERYSVTSAANGSTVLIPYGTWVVGVSALNALGVEVVSAAQPVTLGPAPASPTANAILKVAL
jgi:prepilin-type N-terminal cleavage/methylation domain-containing protein